MGIITALISAALCALFYVRMVRREIPEPLSKKQAVQPVVIGLLAPILATVLTLGIGLAISALTGGAGLSAMIHNLVLSSLVKSFFTAGLTEELVKFLLLLIIVKRLHPKNVYEYALMAAGIGFGFTILEEIAYSADVATSLLRLPGFGLHMVFGLIMGLELGLAQYSKEQNLGSAGRHMAFSLLLPILWHTVFDAASATNMALSADDDYIGFIGLIVGLVIVLVSMVLQFVVLALFKKRTEIYCGMELH